VEGSRIILIAREIALPANSYWPY